jgi:DNA (cytosine-5)-methyltransferase 1
MNALSLFSGIGGLDLAAEAAGIRPVAMCEKDEFCRKVLRKHWPDVPIFEDVKELRGEDVIFGIRDSKYNHDYYIKNEADERGIDIDGKAIDVIYGGFPCQ